MKKSVRIRVLGVGVGDGLATQVQEGIWLGGESLWMSDVLASSARVCKMPWASDPGFVQVSSRFATNVL